MVISFNAEIILYPNDIWSIDIAVVSEPHFFNIQNSFWYLQLCQNNTQRQIYAYYYTCFTFGCIARSLLRLKQWFSTFFTQFDAHENARNTRKEVE